MLGDLHFPFFFNDTATTEIYTLSLHDALPISEDAKEGAAVCRRLIEASRDPSVTDPLVAAYRFVG